MRRRRTHRLFGVAVLAAVLLAQPAAADPLESYRLGLEAYEAGELQEAARQFTRAIAEDPEASGLLSGALLRRYTPHYYLGLSLAGTGRCREAIRALDESERQAKIRDRELETLQETRDRCRRLVDRVQAAAARASEVADGAAELLYGLARLETAPVLGPIWNEGDPSFAGRNEEAAGLLTEARNRIQQGIESLEPELIQQGEDLAEQARVRLEGVRGDAEARRDELLPRVRARLGELDTLARQTEREVRFVRSRFAPLPKSLAEVVEVTEASIEVADRADESTSLDLIAQVEKELEASLRRLRGAVQAPPDELMDAAASLFAGRYERVVELLADRDYRDARADQQACLLRAAARFGILRSEGASDEELRAAVRDVVDFCPSETRGGELPARYFSPAFRHIWSGLDDAPSPASPEPTE